MNKKLISAFVLIVFLILTAILDYPFIIQLKNSKMQKEKVQTYEEFVKEAEEKEKENMRAEIRSYNEGLIAENGLSITETFGASGDLGVTDHILQKIGIEGVIGTIRIPDIDILLPIYGDTSEASLENGAGLLEGTSLPAEGEGIHTCILAHRGLPEAEMFTNLDLIETDDVFAIDFLGQTYNYRVYAVEVVEPQEVESLKIKPEKNLVTLVTCTPYAVNSHRIYVHGEKIVEIEEKEVGHGNMESLARRYWWIAASVLIVIAALWLVRRINRSGER